MIAGVDKTEVGTVRLDRKTGLAHLVGETAPANRVQPAPLSERQLKLCMRIRELIKSRPRRDVMHSIDERDWVYARYARAIIFEHTQYQHQRAQYRGLSEVDRARKFWRAMEDICDRSNAIPGLPPWNHK